MEEMQKKCSNKERKKNDVHIRMNDNQLELLETLSFENEKTKTDMIVKALTFYHNYQKGLKTGKF